MNNAYINLARSWRSKTFDEIIGQEATVRLVKNSLYRDRLFPVYLLAGQRGCGKTTLGRVFAAAINCEQRTAFIKQPREVVLPCLACPSCIAMRDSHAHPDFHEIDAASHTGVDNIRELIDASSFLPGLGYKRVYLIDEAHMLSKAAFNAFLKILEEPPASVIFMLATTDPHKIPETVRSRCFQLFFDPVAPEIVAVHLARICSHEHIVCEEGALTLIAQETDGSVRDAINKLEQIRLAYENVTAEAVIKELGDMRLDDVISIIETAACSAVGELIRVLDKIDLKRFSATRVWKKTVGVFRALLWSRYGEASSNGLFSEDQAKRIRLCAQKISEEKLLAYLELWYKTEPLFIKTNAQYVLLELLFLRMARGSEGKNIEPIRDPEKIPECMARASDGSRVLGENVKSVQSGFPVATTEIAGTVPVAPMRPDRETDSARQAATAIPPQWSAFVQSIRTKSDPLVFSLFKQGAFDKCENLSVHIVFDKQHAFFKELFDQTALVWQPCLEEVFGAGVCLCPRFETRDGKKSDIKPAAYKNQEAMAASDKKYGAAVPVVTQKVAQKIDIKDENKWPKVNVVLHHFPGTVTEEQGGRS